jgi:hypothetical protein
MPIDPIEFRDTASKILSHLVKEIGSRPAGSPAETAAVDWLEQQFKSVQLTTTRFAVKFQPEPNFFPYYSLAALTFFISGITLQSAGWLSLILPLMVLVLPEGALWLQKVLLPYKEGSVNLLVLPANKTLEQADLILCAHVDSARAIPGGHPFWKKWREEIFYTMMRASWLLLLVGILQTGGFPLPEYVTLVGQIIAFGLTGILIVQDVWEQAGSRGKFTPGANDNASGASVLAALAMAVGQDPPRNLNVGFLFSGAEECGLHGASQFADLLANHNLNPRVVSVDMVGAGTGLRIITRSGTLFPVKTDQPLNEMLKRADPLAEYHAAPRRWGDFVPFIHKGIPASHFENIGTPLSWATYHTEKDDLDVIDPEMLAHVGEVLVQVIWILDKNK